MDLRLLEPLVPYFVWTRDVMLAHGVTDKGERVCWEDSDQADDPEPHRSKSGGVLTLYGDPVGRCAGTDMTHLRCHHVRQNCNATHSACVGSLGKQN